MVQGDISGAEDVAVFGPFRLFKDRRLVEAAGRPVHLGGRALDILVALIDRAGEIVSKSDIIDTVWPNMTVEEASLRVQIAALRKALGDGKARARYVANVPGRGYCFVAPVSRSKSVALEAPTLSAFVLPHNLPPRLTRMVGRDDAVRAISEKLTNKSFVTIVGPGGIGKTTVAVSVAHQLLTQFDGAVYFVDLGTLKDPSLVAGSVAHTLGLQVNSDSAVPSLIDALRNKRLLLVLDNCEHVIEAVSTLSESLFMMAPLVHILATSREAMRVEGEHVHRLVPLDYPSDDSRLTAAEALGFPAVQLFMERVAATSDRPALSDYEAPTVAEICRKLDGLPLAIEFAASRVATLGVFEVAARLNDRFALLTKGRRTALPRHQTLRAALDWSYELLPQPEQRLLRRLAIFSGGFTLEAAKSVVNEDECDASIVADGISNMVSKCLLAFDGSTGSGRWRLLETTRAYALEKLGESGGAERAARRHAEFFRDYFASIKTRSKIEATAEDLARYRQEIDNVRAALDWSFSPAGDSATGVALAAEYAWVWVNLSLFFECGERAGQALDRIAAGSELDSALRPQLLFVLAIALTNMMGPVERTRDVLVTALQVADSHDNLGLHLWILWALWALQLNVGEYRQAQSTAERYALVAARTGDPAAILPGHRLIGTTLHFGGDQHEARRALARALAPPFSGQYPQHPAWPQQHRAMTLAGLARTLWVQGFAIQARDMARESFDLACAEPPISTRFEVLRLAVCPVAIMSGDLVAAEQAVTAMAELAARTNAVFWKVVSESFEGALLIRRGDFESGLTLLSAVLDTYKKTGWKPGYPQYQAVLAKGLAGLGRYAEAVATVDEAMGVANHGGVRWYVAEFLRIKGKFLLQEAGDDAIPVAEGLFREALTVAREQGALSWELRAASSLACLNVRQGRRNEAREVLAPVYQQFTEGFETADLRAARATLEAL